MLAAAAVPRPPSASRAKGGKKKKGKDRHIKRASTRGTNTFAWLPGGEKKKKKKRKGKAPCLAAGPTDCVRHRYFPRLPWKRGGGREDRSTRTWLLLPPGVIEKKRKNAKGNVDDTAPATVIPPGACRKGKGEKERTGGARGWPGDGADRGVFSRTAGRRVRLPERSLRIRLRPRGEKRPAPLLTTSGGGGENPPGLCVLFVGREGGKKKKKEKGERPFGLGTSATTFPLSPVPSTGRKKGKKKKGGKGRRFGHHDKRLHAVNSSSKLSSQKKKKKKRGKGKEGGSDGPRPDPLGRRPLPFSALC